MILKQKDIVEMASGYEMTVESDAGVEFLRFTDSEFSVYDNERGLLPRLYNPAGVKMRFKTDAREICIDLFTKNGTDRLFFALDVYSDDDYIGSICNYDGDKIVPPYSECCGRAVEYPSGDFSGCFELPSGEKEIKIFLPWSLPTVIKRIELKGATFFEPVKYDKSILIYGDSITHGYDSLNPSRAYSVRLAEALSASCHIKAIGGDVFRPALAEAAEVREYDYISIAYGTNDYGTYNNIQNFREKADRFITVIREKFPNSQIFVITPIWRKFLRCEGENYNMQLIHDTLKSVCRDIPGTGCIYGWELVPHEESMYGDLSLHPSNEGFDHYIDNLLKFRDLQKRGGDAPASCGEL